MPKHTNNWLDLYEQAVMIAGHNGYARIIYKNPSHKIYLQCKPAEKAWKKFLNRLII